MMIILISVYLISVLLRWNYTRRAYSAKGRWSNIDPNGWDILYIFLPIFNTMFAIFDLFNSPMRETKKADYSKFFNIKK